MASQSCPVGDGSLPVPSSGAALTFVEVSVLRCLQELDRRCIENGIPGWTFDPISFGGAKAARVARRLAERGLVHVERVSERHLRYAITAFGDLALAASGERGQGPTSAQGNSGRPT